MPDRLDEFATLSGLERAQPAALAVRSPAYARFGISLDAVGEGTSTYRMPGDVRLAGAGGRLSAGLLCLIADASLGNASLTLLPAGQASSTSQLRLDFVGPLPEAGAPVTARAAVVGEDGATTLIAGELNDAAGSILALTSARCVVVPAAYPADVLAGGIASADHPPTLESMLGVCVSTGREGDARIRFAPGPNHTNIFGIVHGGVLGAVLEYAAALAAGPASVALDLRVRYLRPVPVAGEFEVVGRAVHRTRRQTVVDMHIQAAGKMLVTAQGTYLVDPKAEA